MVAGQLQSLPGADELLLTGGVRLRAEPLEPSPYLLALTGFSTALHQDRARQAGIDLYLVKPAEPRQLQQVLADWSRADQRL